jgi:intracellular sulfur oxidation DsrE/DsrF family protein
MRTNPVLISIIGSMVLSLAFSGVAGAWDYPVIKGYGPVHPLPQAAIQPDKALHYKVLFDIKTPAKETSKVNPGLNHVARFINVMASAGLLPDQMEMVAVIHGNAAPIVLKNEIFKEKFKVDNPNIKLISDLKKAGVKLYVCGQSLADFTYKPEWVNPDIVLTLSALVDVPTFQLKGYAYLPF